MDPTHQAQFRRPDPIVGLDLGGWALLALVFLGVFRRKHALVLGGGVGKRMKAKIPKQMLHLGPEPVIVHATRPFVESSEFEKVALVLAPQYRQLLRDTFTGKPLVFGDPGDTRQQSVLNGLKALEAEDEDLILIHDGARPFVDPAMVARIIEGAEKFGAAVPALPVAPTIKVSEDGQLVSRTLDRSKLMAIQTPQAVRCGDLLRGLEEAARTHVEVTDDASALEILGLPVALVEGHPDNLKLTGPEDWAVAELIFRRS